MSKEKLIPELRFPEFENEGEWENKPLEEILNFQTGFPFDSAGFNEEGKGIRLIKNRDLKSDDKLVHYSKPYDEKYLVTDGDVLVGMDGDFTPVKWNKGTALLNQRVGRVLTKKKGDESFFLYFLSIHLKAIEEKTARTTVKHLSHSVVEKINEPLPKPLEQQKIASCLSSLDEIITAHSQKLDLLKDHKKGLMQNLFPQEGEKVPKYRFKEFEKDEEWVLEPFHKVYSFLVTNSLSREFLNYENGMVKNIHYGDIHTKFSTLFDITKEKVPYISPHISIEKIREECYCLEGDIIFADASEDLNDVGKSIEIVNLNGEKLLSGLHTLMARQIDKKLEIGFGGHLFKSYRIRKQIQKEAQGAKVLGISGTRISNIKIYYPENPKEQQKIASCLSSLDALITAQTEKIEQLKWHKKGLMQGLFPKLND
jgi:type I restriction enzyme S subunit